MLDHLPTLRPHTLQDYLYRTRKRFPVVPAGRGSGKSEVCRRKLTRYAGMQFPTKNPMLFYALPTTAQARRVAWESLKSMVPPDWYRKGSQTFFEAERVIWNAFNAEIHVVGLDQPQRIEGNQWCAGVIDECSDQKPKVFDLSIRPALTAFKGWCARIGVPKRYGVGSEDFKAAFDLGMSGIDADTVSLTWHSSTVVEAKELAAIKAVLDPRDYAEQYEASWEQISGAIFYSFHEELSVTSKEAIRKSVYNPIRTIVVGSDFNVDPMCWTLCHRAENELVAFDELNISNTNTRETLDILHDRYGEHNAGWEFFGDATGQARRTSAELSDYLQILNDERFNRKEVYYPDSNPSRYDRFSACNAMFCNADGVTRFFVNPRCKRLIADLKHRSFKPGTKEAADSGAMGHMSDALGYIISSVWPIEHINGDDGQVVLRRRA